MSCSVFSFRHESRLTTYDSRHVDYDHLLDTHTGIYIIQVSCASIAILPVHSFCLTPKVSRSSRPSFRPPKFPPAPLEPSAAEPGDP